MSKPRSKLYGLYSIKWRNAKTPFKWTPPFLAIDDGTALNALLDMSKECPELQNKYLCRIGWFDPSKGVVKGCKAVVVHQKRKVKTDEK